MLPDASAPSARNRRPLQKQDAANIAPTTIVTVNKVRENMVMVLVLSVIQV